MTHVRPRRIWLVVAAIFVAMVPNGAGDALAAESYPARPIRVIVTFPPGGSTDLMARAVQPQFEKRLGQPIIIDNRPGAGGVIGVDAVAKAMPDGYVIGIGAAGALAVNVSLIEKLPYDPFTDLAPISGLAQSPFVLAAPPSFPGSSIADVIALAKAKPQSLSIGHGGNGTAMHLTAQLFNHLAGLDIALVPYRGSGPVTQDLMAGHIPLGITDSEFRVADRGAADQGNWNNEPRPFSIGTGCSDLCGIRIAGLRVDRLVRVRGAGRHATGGHSDAQRRDRGGAS